MSHASRWGFFFLLVSMVACQTPAAPTPTPAPTLTPTMAPSPSATVTPTVTSIPLPPTSTPTPLPTATPPLPTPTPTAGPAPAAAAPAPAAPLANPTGAVARGRSLFLQVGCSECHGEDASGGFGPRIANTALSFEQVLSQVRQPRDRMVAFDPSVLSDQQVRDIYAFLKSLP